MAAQSTLDINPADVESVQEYCIRRKDLSDAEAEEYCRNGPATVFTAKRLVSFLVDGLDELTTVDPRIGQLTTLLRLSYSHTGLESLPVEIGTLQHLKYLDLSANKLSSIPKQLYTLRSLQTIVLARNNLTEQSFPDLSEVPQSGPLLPELRHVNISHNQLQALPAWVCKAEQVTELLASDNAIAGLGEEILLKGHLRVLDLARNSLSSLPCELTELKKLKTLQLLENPLKDKRLAKLIAQHGDTKPKAILDYIYAHTVKAGGDEAAKLKDAKLKAKGGATKSKGPSPAAAKPLHTVEVQKVAAPITVTASNAVRAQRPYLLCTVVKKLDLSLPKDIKKFLAIQTTLHDTVCNRRRLATLATHNLAAITPPLNYSTRLPEEVSLVPLGYSKEMTAKAFVALLEANKAPSRGGGKKSSAASAKKPADPQAAALSKYLDLIQGQSTVAFLSDSEGSVISLPPLTNSSNTMLSEGVWDVLIEVSSSRSLQGCKTVMNDLILEMLRRGMSSVIEREVEEAGGHSSDSGSDDGSGVVFKEPVPSSRQQGSHLVLEIVRVVDETGGLLTVFPSRTDLQFQAADIAVHGL